MVRWVVGVLLAAILSVPAASAELTMMVDAPTSLIRPEGAPGVINVNLTLDCKTAWLVAPPHVNPEVPITVSFNVSRSGVLVEGPHVVILSTSACLSPASDPVHGVEKFFVTMSRLAPGLEKIAVVAHAQGPRAKQAGGVQIYPDQDANATFDMEGDYYPYVSAKTEATSLEAAPGEPSRFVFHVDNFGNSRTTVSLAIVNTYDPRWNVTLPAPVQLDSPLTLGGNSSALVEVVVVAQAQGVWTNNDQAFFFAFKPAAASDPTKTGQVITQSVMARVRGASAKGLPDAAPMAGLALLAAALFALRRRAS